mmetsp:Transcript_23141/g.36451  ORF Transcript_23141/g.36451 Transcript_23141/m.36451 type:complete len:199 (-) Transcript_23141:409-1005(-)
MVKLHNTLFALLLAVVLPVSLGFQLSSRTSSSTSSSHSLLIGDSKFSSLRSRQNLAPLQASVAVPPDNATPNEADLSSDEEVVRTVLTVEDFYDVMRENKDKIVVVKFYATWCTACKTISKKYERLAKDFDGSTFKFCQIELEESKDLCKALDVKVLPSVHFYKGRQGKIEDMSCGPRNWVKVMEKVLEYRMAEDDSH